MEKRLVKNSIILISIIVYIFLYKFVITEHCLRYSYFITASFLAMLFAVSILLLGFRKDKSTILFQNIIKFTAFYLLLTGFVIYGMGFFVGFLKNAYSRELFTIIDNIFVPIVIFILIELIRYVFIWANKDKKVFVVLFTIIIIVFELFFKVRTFTMNDFDAVFRFVAATLLPTIVKNIFFSYLCFHVGYKTPIFYRLLTDVFYVYIVPIVPDIGEYLYSIVAISLPVLIYINIYDMVDSKCDKPRPLVHKQSFSIADGIVTVILIILVGLVSGLFPIYMIGIGSASMSPTINKGDAVIIQKVNAEQDVKEGDIIAFSKTTSDHKSIIVVHRVEEITKENGIKTFITKGDANQSKDVSLVSAKQVKGVVKFRIPFIAYPTIIFGDFIQSGR